MPRRPPRAAVIPAVSPASRGPAKRLCPCVKSMYKCPIMNYCILRHFCKTNVCPDPVRKLSTEPQMCRPPPLLSTPRRAMPRRCLTFVVQPKDFPQAHPPRLRLFLHLGSEQGACRFGRLGCCGPTVHLVPLCSMSPKLLCFQEVSCWDVQVGQVFLLRHVWARTGGQYDLVLHREHGAAAVAPSDRPHASRCRWAYGSDVVGCAAWFDCVCLRLPI